MQVSLIDASKIKYTPAKYAERNRYGGITRYDFGTPEHEDRFNSIIFHYFFAEVTVSRDSYLPAEVFKKQVEKASKDFKDKDFQLLTFNVPENNKFGPLMKDLGFDLVGEAPGQHNTSVYFYVKAKKKR